MDASSASWTRIPRDYHEQQRLQLEHRLFASSARSNSEISDDHSSFNLEDDDEHDGQLNGDMDGRRSPQLQYSSSEFSMEYPRNPQVELANADDYSLSNPMHRQPREGDTRSTFAHHASGITFRTGLRGTRDSRSRDFSAGPLSDTSIDYDPDRPLEALLQRASDLSILRDSPRDTPRSEFATRAQGLAKQMMAGDNRSSHQSHSNSAKNNNRNGSFGAANTTLKPTHKSLAELTRTPMKSAFHAAAAAPTTTRLFSAYGGGNGKVQLPDVTGITSAVATPLKGDPSFRRVADLKPSSTFASRLHRQSQPTASASSKPSAASTSKPNPAFKPTISNKESDSAANPTSVLDTLTHRLHQIERESLTSRRRVNELERELDMCKSVVDIERSRMGELSIRHAHASANASAGQRRRNRSTRDVGELDAAALDTSFRETQRRYREAVGEEKELEALVKALHAHLRRTSTTVESHKQIINQLRAEAAQTRPHQRHPSTSVPSSAALPPAAAQIWDEVERVKAEVEVLWGDVGRLRGVVEGGLGLRRAREGGVIARDGKEVISGSVIRDEDLSDLGRDEGPDEEVEQEQDPREEERHQQERSQERQHQYSDEEEDREERQVDFLQEERREWGVPVLSAVLEEDEPASTRASIRSPLIPTTNVHAATAHHTSAPNSSGRFIQDEELERVRAEVEERRSLRSMSMSGSEKSTAGGALRSSALNRVLESGGNAGGRISPIPARVTFSSTSRLPTGARHGLQQHTPPRPLTPDSDGELQRKPEAHRHVEQPSEKHRQPDNDLPDRQRVASPLCSSALPQIRGERLERLFYAAPEHNSRTCGVCHRRRRAGHVKVSSNSGPIAPVPVPVSVGAGVSVGVGADGDIKFCEGDERRIAEIAAQSGVPPQTILARVLRELEDDFTHYKSIYVELADQYKAMDAASDMGKRNLLANHLRDVIDVLEQKGDQIASLYDLLHFEDKPLAMASSSRHHNHHKHDHMHSRRTRLS